MVSLLHSMRQRREPAPPNPFTCRYLLFEEIGRGRCASVHFALDIDRKTTAAVKIGDASDFQRKVFANEAEALSRLSHPNVVGLLDCGVSCGLPYIAMEHVPGMNLRESRLKMGLRERLGTVAAVCGALEAAHEAGIVHRDVKPKNIVVSRADGQARLLDFGFALLDGVSPVQAGRFGNPLYAAPEQKENRGYCDHRADIYSAGILLYEQLIQSPAPLIDMLRIAGIRSGSVPIYFGRHGQAEIEAFCIVERAVEREPAGRFQSAGEMRKAVERVIEGLDAA
ncbi:MAG: serine/threonine-protein kinase [Candidatus Micrarchaeota archaeon]